MQKKNHLMFIIAMLISFFIGITGTVYSFSSEDIAVDVQLYLVNSEGNTINDEYLDINLRLVFNSAVGNIVLWEKSYSNELIEAGYFRKVMTGLDDSGSELTAEMFDEEDVDLEVQVGDEVFILNLVSHPYAIKSRISEKSP